MSQGQYVATRPFPTTHRQYEIGDMIDTSRITSSELNAGVISGAIEPAKFIDTAARLAALNPVLGPGVHAYETDTGVHKIGIDGVTRYADLDQVGSGTYASYLNLAAQPESIITGTITRDVNGAATGATVTWPDGTTGTYTGTASSVFPGAVDSYTITYGSPATRTYTQAAVTRDATGAVTVRPAVTVA